MPAAQLPAHVVAPKADENKPATQDWHTVTPVVEEYMPAPHVIQGAVIPKPDE